jgi:hypothetical protein
MGKKPAVSHIEQIRRALAARSIDGSWENGLRAYVERVDGVSLPRLAAELSDELGFPVPVAILARLRTTTYVADPIVGPRASRVRPIRTTARRRAKPVTPLQHQRQRLG